MLLSLLKNFPISISLRADYLFFIFSKIFNFFLDPLNLLLISFLLFIVVITRAKRNKFKGTFWFILFWFVLLYKPLPEFLVKNLEDKFTYKEEVFLKLDGIIILGGGTGSGKIAKDRNDLSLGPASERIFKALQFIKHKPYGNVIFTGFSGNIFHEGLSEAEITEGLIKALDIASGNIIFEKASRNSFENALNTKDIINDLQIKKWGIVTSASHMSRAIATFQKQTPESRFVPLPVDFQTANSIYWGPGSMQGSINYWRIYLHEIFGYWAYKLTGKL
jgi:uncharacterized SAM-binding protein YcdF (DUF218 family)